MNDTVALQLGETAQALQSSRYQIITLQSVNNNSSTISIRYGSNREVISLPRGEPVIWPYSQDFNNNAIRIESTPPGEGVTKVGIYGLSAETTYQFPDGGGTVTLSQYESVSEQTLAKLKSYYIYCASPALIAYVNGNNSPEFFAISTSESSHPSAYKYISEDIQYIENDQYQFSNNWQGVYVALFNLSVTPSTCTISN
ncbi:hypothetical protein [Hahella sp. CCB-MM4]|uniref:hypothetical protein n=1 Tax=Hahella sp. (strain CCB-MM4) TaxID=1926491 RepID=UPI0011407BF4|nr:hypothetical protein [Hahella sp. CCB-MM4]